MTTTDDLEKMLKKREEEIESLNLHHKIASVCKILGKGRDYDRGNSWHYEFARKDLHLEYSQKNFWSGGSDCCWVPGEKVEKATYCGTVVYHREQFSITAYIPGSWENLLNNYSSEANKEEKRREKKSRQEKETKKATTLKQRLAKLGVKTE